MSASTIDILQEAVRLCDDARSEVQCRNAVSRTYYGLYHTVLEFAENNYTPPPSAVGGSTHSKLSDMLADDYCKDPKRRLKIRKIGISLRNLHQRRCDADYHLHLSFTPDDVLAHKLACLDRVSEVGALTVAEPAA